MDIILTRSAKRKDGIFGELADSSGNHIAVTLEHAYLQASGGFESKVPVGSYLCVLGKHQLHEMIAPFWTFEVTGVAGHKGVLFHVGNYNDDSEGCILLGQQIAGGAASDRFITNSRNTFELFMNLMSGINTFTLIVQDQPLDTAA